MIPIGGIYVDHGLAVPTGTAGSGGWYLAARRTGGPFWENPVFSESHDD